MVCARKPGRNGANGSAYPVVVTAVLHSTSRRSLPKFLTLSAKGAAVFAARASLPIHIYPENSLNDGWQASAKPSRNYATLFGATKIISCDVGLAGEPSCRARDTRPYDPIPKALTLGPLNPKALNP